MICAEISSSVSVSESEARNPKQIQNTNVKNPRDTEFFAFEIRILKLFRISGFGFRFSDRVKS